MGLPGYPLRAQVIAHAPEQDGVYVMLMSGQILGYPVRRLYAQADGLRISKPPLPVRGSWGLVQFPGGDIRNGTWMGAYHPNMVDAIPNGPNDPFSDYESHYSGHWSYLSGASGYSATQFADTSVFVMGSGSLDLPTIYRHTVSSGQAQQRVPFTQQERNPNPQPPFGWRYSQAVSGNAGGLTITVDVSGNFSVSSSVSGHSCTLSFNGTTLVIDGSGNLDITSTAGEMVVTMPVGIWMTVCNPGGKTSALPVKLSTGADSIVLRAQ